MKTYGKDNRKAEPLRVGGIVHRAIRDGKLVRPDYCTCCLKECKPDAHHEDYDYPFDIIWLCRSCHKKLHAMDNPPVWLWKARAKKCKGYRRLVRNK